MCNLNCRYCFYHDIVEKREQRSYGFMEEKTLEAVVQKSLAAATQDCTIAFQGGEPTLISTARPSRSRKSTMSAVCASTMRSRRTAWR